MNPKILLNCFPPTSIYMPAFGCEVLKCYLTEKKNIDTEVVYWNHLFQDLYKSTDGNLSPFTPKDDVGHLLPFLSILAERSNNSKIRERIILKMQEASPGLKAIGFNYYREKYYEQIEKTNKIIKDQLIDLLTDDVLVFGVSAKFDAWIPGVIVAQEVKKIRPDIKCIIGGIEEVQAAKALFNLFDVFDFAVWGEGEVPTSMLVEKLLTNSKDYNIPRILHREEDADSIILKSAKLENVESYYNIKEYLNIDYKDYFKYSNMPNNKNVKLPIEISRGCRWNKCNFCALNWGLSYRTQDFNNVVEQIKEHYLKHKITEFFFVDNDVVGKNMKLFQEFLDALIDLSDDLEVDFIFHADILHLDFNKEIIKKLSLAGFKSVQIGYEGISDSMLKKMNKSTSFSENLLFIKFAQKYDIQVTISGLIIGLPNELEEDVIESTDNLHYLRFFLGNTRNKLQHSFAELVLFYNTNFWHMLSETEREKFNRKHVNDFLADELMTNLYIKYALIGQTKTPLLNDKWYLFKTISDHYEKSTCDYYLIENNNIISYIEYKTNVKVDSIVFDQPEYWDVLKIANDEIVSFSKIYEIIKSKYKDIQEDRLNEIIQELNNSYLLYSSANKSKNISIIDTDQL